MKPTKDLIHTTCATSHVCGTRTRAFVWLLLLWLIHGTAAAQRHGSGTMTDAGEESWQHYYEMIIDDDGMLDTQAEDMYDMLEELAANKINLNRATRDDLERLVFLSDQQLQDIAEYIDRYGPVRSMAELAMIQSLDATRCRLLSFFVYAGEPRPRAALPPLDTLLRRSKSELTAAIKCPLYTRDGYLLGTKKGYLGPKYKHWLRYKTAYGRQLEVGFTAAQDAGEPFFTGHNRWGYDFYSFYAVARNIKWLKTAVAGRYRLKLGLGLVMNTDFSFGKAASLDALARTANSLRPHSSRSEAHYLQGAAATAALSRHVALTAFLSHRLVDATLNKDSVTAKTILYTGYHRTASEMQRRRNTSQTTGGASLALQSGAFKGAVSVVGTMLGRRLQPDTSAVFRRYYLHGRRWANASLTYSYMSHDLQIAGETAIGTSGGMAALHTVGYAPSHSVSLNVIHRYYSYRYRSPFASSFSDGGAVNNEHGLYVGVGWRPLAPLLLTGYADLSRAAWPRYMASQASRSFDSQVSATLTWPSVQISARYRLRIRQRDNATHTALTDRTEQRLRLSATWRHTTWHASMQGDMSLASTDSTSRGWMVMQSGGCKVWKMQIDGSVGLFKTDTYDSRLYVYERGLLYDFSFPMFYGEGLHYALRVRCDLSPRLMFIAKASVTDYFDRPSIGQGLQRINASSQADIEMQVRWKF